MSPEPAPPAISRRRLYSGGILLAAVAAIVVVMGLTTRKMSEARLSEWTEEQALPVVAVAPPIVSSDRVTFELPGRLEAYIQAQIFARVSGYLKSWNADIGTPVKAGDILGEIDAPDLDQQIMQAEANLASAQANSRLSDATLLRGQQLINSGAVSKQDIDQRAADSENKQGLVRSAKANLDRLRVLEQYKHISAPFDGLVTARSTDVGALINAGGGGAPLFVVSDTSRLRLYVNVPQSYVPSVKIGTKARIAVPEYPDRKFFATVEASAQAVDVASGTTRMLLVVDNADGALMTGDFTTVSFELPRPAGDYNVPASALIFDRTGLRVATVGAGSRVALKQVTIARDLGREVEIGAGLTADDRIIQSPPDGIQDGDLVRLAGETGKHNVGADTAAR